MKASSKSISLGTILPIKVDALKEKCQFATLVYNYK
jgi:hypothetical protein